jgi:hypothetical protein
MANPPTSQILYINSLSPWVIGRSACVFYGRTGLVYNWPQASIFYGGTGLDGRTDGRTNGFSSGKRRGGSLSFLWFFALRFVSRSWNPDPNCPSVEVLKPEVLKPSVRLSRSWNPVSVSRGSETQVLRTRHGRIVSDRHGYPLFLGTDLRLSVCRGPETQIPTVRLSRS